MGEIDRKQYLRPSEVAARWGLTGETVRRMIREGQLPALRTPSGRYLVHVDDAKLRPAVEPDEK